MNHPRTEAIIEEKLILVADREAAFHQLWRRELEEEGRRVMATSNQEVLLRMSGLKAT